MKIIGIDISKNVATCCMLESAPANLKEYSQGKEFVWWHIHPCTEDMEAIAALKPDLIVYEPTGGKYDEAFAHWFRARGFDCRKVAGRRLARYRSEKGLGKNDHLDALSMASYGQEKHQEPSAWIPEQGQAIAKIREQWLQRMSLIRQRASLVNRIRLQLAREFPEAMEFDGQMDWGEPVPGILPWLAEQATGKIAARWDKQYQGGKLRRKGEWVEIPGTFGMGISAYTRFLAQQTMVISGAIAATETAIDQAIAEPEFTPYLEAMASLNFSHSLMVIWLTRIYPFERFLDPDGRERTSQRMSNNGNWCTHNHSLGQFKAALGAAIEQPSSGTKGGIAPTRQKRKARRSKGDKKDSPTPIGCRWCRVAFWQWSALRVETGRATGEPSQKLITKRNELKEKGKNIFQRSGNLHGYAARLLYRELKTRLK